MRLLSSTDFALRVLIVFGGRPAWPARERRNARGETRGAVAQPPSQDRSGSDGLGGDPHVARRRRRVCWPCAEEIWLGTLIRQLEEDQAIVECFRAGGCSCTYCRCRLRGMLGRGQDRFHASLNQQTLADCCPPLARDRRAKP